ncbi:hypothetical protein [Halorientalis salina]|nr:hypothetical protein [Halorientalis salina]
MDSNLDPSAVAVARCSRLTSVPDRDGVRWETADEEWGLTTRRSTSTITTGAGHVTPQQVRWVTDGDVAAYVDEYGDGEVWAIPDTFDGFNKIDTYVSFVDGQADQYGYGTDGQALEKAFRVLTGGGRYDASDYSVIPCSRQPWILSGPEGTLLCSCFPVDCPSDENQRRTSTITPAGRAIEIEEENSHVLAGANHFVELLTEVEGVEILETEYDQVRDRTIHIFYGGGAEWKISAEGLATLGRIVLDPAMVPVAQERMVQLPNSTREIHVEWDGPTHQVGECVDDAIVAGYKFTWENPDDALECIATVRTYRIKNSHSRYRVEYRSDRIATVIPKKRVTNESRQSTC